MYRSDVISEESHRTAFRKAEKKYKIYYDYSSKKKRVPMPVDLSEVVDFRSILEKYNCSGELVEGVSVLKCDFDQPIFCLESRPGFYYIPAALSLEEQCQWIRESLTSFPQPPNLTNHNAIYGPIEDLFVSAKEGKVLVFEDELPGDVCSDINVIQSDSSTPRWKFVEAFDESNGRDACKSVSASVLLRDMLGGHLDDMEKDWSKPIVSMSLGCKAIFLLGGKSREDKPTAMFLRSGDVILMAGEARECFHGVPRIFTDAENAEISRLESQFAGGDDQPYLKYIRTSRININIRQVF